MAGDSKGTIRVWEGVSKRKANSSNNNSNDAPSSMSGRGSESYNNEQIEKLIFRLRDQYAHAHLSTVTATAIAQWQKPIRLVVSGGDDWTIRLWETVIHYDEGGEGDNDHWEKDDSSSSNSSRKGGDVGDVHGGWSKILRGHTGPITDISLDMCKVTSCSLDGTIKIWGTVGKNAGNCIRTLSHPFSGARNIPVRCISVGSLRLVAGYDDGTLLLFTFHKKEKYQVVRKDKVMSKKKITNAWRKGGNSPQAKRHPKNTLKGSNRKYVSGGNRRSMRDLKSKTTKNVDKFMFDFDDL
jgi:hypothetical protein